MEERELREAGWGLVAMGLRDQGLGSEIWRALLGRKVQPTEPDWVGPGTEGFTRVAQILDEREDAVRVDALARVRQAAVTGTAPARVFPLSLRERRAGEGGAPAMPRTRSCWKGWCSPRRLTPRDFYFPAQLLHGLALPDMEQIGASIVELIRARVV